MAISLSTISNWLIVMPKIRRLFSGEKVVISNMLRRVNNLASSQSTSTSSFARMSALNPITASTTPTIIATDSRTKDHQNNSNTENSGTGGLNPATSDGSDDNGTRRRKPKIHLKEEDPIPKVIEQGMYAMNELIQRVTNAA
jgi:hypothetical protein